MNDTFVVGDIVSLKSGGPSMTVVDVGEQQGVRAVSTQWFDGADHLHNGAFRVETVVRDK